MDPKSEPYVPSSSNIQSKEETPARRKFFFPKAPVEQQSTKEKKKIVVVNKKNQQSEPKENRYNDKKKIVIKKRTENNATEKIVIEENYSPEENDQIEAPMQSSERRKIIIEKSVPIKSKHSEQSQEIIKKMSTMSYSCMICMEVIKRKEQIWHCIYCFRIFHLGCTKKWHESCLQSEEMENQNVWSCPHCRSLFSDPPSFVCYCGKEKKPAFNTYSIVGSCSQICNKKRKGDCPHPCQNACHPGSCPPCDEVSVKKCFCSKTKYTIGCSDVDEGRSCGEKCGKILNCGVHYCEKLCHMGDCGECHDIQLQVCYCGETEQEKRCGTGELDESSGEDRYFSCGVQCNQLLSCGKHNCERTCHKGDCPPCATDPNHLKYCPCGKVQLDKLLNGKQRTFCTDEIPVCDNVCDKLLACGIHKCKRKCHTDKCGGCLSERKVRCRCGSTKMVKQCLQIQLNDIVVPGKQKGNIPPPNPTEIPRVDSILCNKKCNQLKSCGKHKCANICCISMNDKDDLMGLHTCTLPCAKKLNCKKHRCDLICHNGNCSPCLEASFEPRSCPCGKTVQEPPIRCGAAKLNCPHQCIFERPCGHSAQNHLSLKHPCHFDTKKCTPCSVLVSVMCWCGKERRNNVPCNQSEGVRCANKCGKQLSCGIHFCDRVCHRDECQKTEEFTCPTPPCHQICGIQLQHCEHRCIQKCHPTSDCNVSVCQQTSTIYCDCKRKKMTVICGLGEDEDKNKMLLEQRANLLMCDKECEEQMHKNNLALAFGKLTSSFAQTLVDLAKLHPNFIERIEKVFFNLINRDKLSETRYTFPPTIAFPAMDSVRRKILHLLAKTYFLETVSLEEDEGKRVVVKCNSGSKVPKLLLSAYLNLKKNPTDKNCFNIGLLISDLLKINMPFQIDNVFLDTYFKYYKGKYEFHWITEDNVLVVFEDNKTMNQALNSVNGPFSLKIYNENMTFVGDNSRPSKPRKVYSYISSPKEIKKVDKEWEESNKNFFSALKDEAPKIHDPNFTGPTKDTSSSSPNSSHQDQPVTETWEDLDSKEDIPEEK